MTRGTEEFQSTIPHIPSWVIWPLLFLLIPMTLLPYVSITWLRNLSDLSQYSNSLLQTYRLPCHLLTKLQSVLRISALNLSIYTAYSWLQNTSVLLISHPIFVLNQQLFYFHNNNFKHLTLTIQFLFFRGLER